MTDQPPAPAPDSSVAVNGVNLHYQQSGSGPLMVLIHGLTGSRADWNLSIVPQLADAFSLLTYDLRGHGYSDMPESGYTSAAMAADLLGLLDALGIERAHVVGHSFGGTVALHFTALHPTRVQALTISDSRVRSLQPSQKIKDWAHWPLWREQLRRQNVTVDAESELDFTLLELLFAQRRQALSPAEKRRMDQWTRFLETTHAGTELREVAGLTPQLIRTLQVPTQAVYAEYSFCLPTLEGLKECIQGLSSTILPGVGHFFPITRPEMFVKVIRDFHLPRPLPNTPDTPAPEVS